MHRAAQCFFCFKALRLLSELGDDGKVDELINAIIHELCKRPFVNSEDQGQGVSVCETLHALLTAPASDTQSNNHVYMQVGTKFWEAKLVGISVEVRFGKKGTQGQSNTYTGADARDYFDKKVHEKLRKGYKVVDRSAAQKRAIVAKLDALMGGGEEAGARPKRGRAPAKRERVAEVVNDKPRADFDKCGALLSYLVARVLGKSLDEEHEHLHSLFGEGESMGSDVCYGPVCVYSAEDVAAVAASVANVSREQIETLFDDAASFPQCLGALCDVTKERDQEYALIHFAALQRMLAVAADKNCGLLVHFW